MFEKTYNKIKIYELNETNNMFYHKHTKKEIDLLTFKEYFENIELIDKNRHIFYNISIIYGILDCSIFANISKRLFLFEYSNLKYKKDKIYYCEVTDNERYITKMFIRNEKLYGKFIYEWGENEDLV